MIAALVILAALAVAALIFAGAVWSSANETAQESMRCMDVVVAKVLERTAAQQQAMVDEREKLITALLTPDERIVLEKLRIQATQAADVARATAQARAEQRTLRTVERMDAAREAERYEDITS